MGLQFPKLCPTCRKGHWDITPHPKQCWDCYREESMSKGRVYEGEYEVFEDEKETKALPDDI